MNLAKIDISIEVPSKEEQSKIAALLWLLDQRIATQIKIIEKYESLIDVYKRQQLLSANRTTPIGFS